MEVFTQWSILHLVIVAVEMHLLGFFLVPLLPHSPSPNPKPISCLAPNFAGRWIVTVGFLPVEPFSPGMSLQCVLLLWLSRSIQRHRPCLDESLAMPTVHSHFMYNCGSITLWFSSAKPLTSQPSPLSSICFLYVYSSMVFEAGFSFSKCLIICFAASLNEMGRSCVSVTLTLPRGQYIGVRSPGVAWRLHDHGSIESREGPFSSTWGYFHCQWDTRLVVIAGIRSN